MKKLTEVLRKNRRQPDALMAALTAMPVCELVCALTELVAAGRVRLCAVRRRGRAQSLCARFARYHEANPRVFDWFLNAAREKKAQGRTHYAIGCLLEKIRHDVKLGVIRTDDFRISNDFQAVYVRAILMRDSSLIGMFELKPSAADELIFEGRTWRDFACEHEAELWPGREAKKNPASTAQTELPLSETA